MQDAVLHCETEEAMVAPVAERQPRDQTVQSLLRAVAILEAFRECPAMGVTELAAQVGLHKATTHRLLTTLEHVGYVVQDRDTGRYSLGLKILDLARALLPQLDVRERALPAMRQLMAETAETVHLGVWESGEVVCVESVSSDRPVAIARMVGKRPRLHVSSMGKVVLAYQDAATVDRFIAAAGLPALTPRSICDPDAFREHLKMVRRHGYAINDEEEEIGIRCVAAPIRDRRGNVIAAVSVAAPSPRLLGATLRHVLHRTMAAAGRISAAL